MRTFDAIRAKRRTESYRKMKQLITTITTALLVGCASLDSSSKVQPSLELTKDGLLVEPESQAPYTGRQSANFNSGAKHWEGTVVDGKRHGQYTIWDIRGTKRSSINFKNGIPHGEWLQWNLKGETELLLEFNEGKRVRAVYPGWTGVLEEKSNRWGWVDEVYKSQDRRWLKFKPSRYPFRYFKRIMGEIVQHKGTGHLAPDFYAPYID